jgi:hypothetical protein
MHFFSQEIWKEKLWREDNNTKIYFRNVICEEMNYIERVKVGLNNGGQCELRFSQYVAVGPSPDLHAAAPRSSSDHTNWML